MIKLIDGSQPVVTQTPGSDSLAKKAVDKLTQSVSKAKAEAVPALNPDSKQVLDGLRSTTQGLIDRNGWAASLKAKGIDFGRSRAGVKFRRALDGLVAHNQDSEHGGGQALDHAWHLVACGVAEVLQGVCPLSDGTSFWRDVRVGQIDTGISKHPAFGNGKDSWIDWKAARTFGASGVEKDGGRSSMEGEFWSTHGTTSASVICGYDGSHQLGSLRYCGVAPKVPLVPVRIGTTVVLWDDMALNFERAVRYLVDQGLPIINVSMGTALPGDPPEAVARALDYCYAHGVILVAAAGNMPLPGWRTYPAALPKAIAIGGVKADKTPWKGGTSGDWVDCSAPASGVWRAETYKPKGKRDPPVEEYRYGFTHGTTLATAMVSGAAAHWLRLNGEYIHKKYQGWQRVEAFRHVLRVSASDFGPSSMRGAWTNRHERETGYWAGILNLQSLLATELPEVSALFQR